MDLKEERRCRNAAIGFEELSSRVFGTDYGVHGAKSDILENVLRIEQGEPPMPWLGSHAKQLKDTKSYVLKAIKRALTWDELNADERRALEFCAQKVKATNTGWDVASSADEALATIERVRPRG